MYFFFLYLSLRQDKTLFEFDMVGKQITLDVTAINRMLWISTYEMKL